MSSPIRANGLSVDELLSFHRATFGSARMDGDGADGNDGDGSGNGGGGGGQTFTQADVDRIVSKARNEERRKAGEKFADYDDLKAKAERATTADAERAKSDLRATRAEVALAKKLTPSQAKRLVGTTVAELEADADELLKDIGAQRSQGNHVPNEGNNPTPKGGELADFTRRLFASGE